MDHANPLINMYSQLPASIDAYWASHAAGRTPGSLGFMPRGGHRLQVATCWHRSPIRASGGVKDPNITTDYRIVSSGLRQYVKRFLSQPITHQMIDELVDFMSTFHPKKDGSGFEPYPFPEQMFRRIVDEFGGIPPVCVLSVPDGQTVRAGEPSTIVFSNVDGMGELVGAIESSLVRFVFASGQVATFARRRLKLLIKWYKKADPSLTDEQARLYASLSFVDFGVRGAIDPILTGEAHLLSFLSTDNIPAAMFAKHELNNRVHFGASSIGASAHRTASAYRTERENAAASVRIFGSGYFSHVLDTRSLAVGLYELCAHSEIIKRLGGTAVARPDSGDARKYIIKVLDVLAEKFGFTIVAGRKLICNARLLIGDGVTDFMMDELFRIMLEAGYHPMNLVIGMGGWLHWAERWISEVAHKTNLIAEYDHVSEEFLGYMGTSKYSDMPSLKESWRGPAVIDRVAPLQMENRVIPISLEQLLRGETGLLVPHFDGRPEPLTIANYAFTDSRELAYRTWDEVPSGEGDTFHRSIREDQERRREEIRAEIAEAAERLQFNPHEWVF